MTALLARLAAMLPWILGGTAVLIVLILGYVAVQLRRARAAAAPPREGGEGGGAISSVLHLRRSFAEGVQALQGYVPGKDYRYRIPWILMLGQTEAGKSTVLRSLELERPFPAPDDAEAGEAGCRWAFFNEGVVLEVPGDFFLRAGGAPDEVAWKALLRLLQEHRTERPIDGVVLAIPCTDLLGPGAPGKEELAARAEAVFGRLWEAQKVLGMRLPVTVLVTKCDAVPGFRSLCERLPEASRHEVFGWSSPYAVEAAFAPEWVDEAFDALHEGLYETQVELLSQPDAGDPDALFRFPGELRRMHLPLRAYLREVFQRTVYHESFFFRGIYFTGDEHADAPDAATPAAEAGAGRPKRHPVFLQQLFRDKVFPEGGLARPLPQALVSRNRRVRVAQAAILAIGILGGVGLWYSHGRLTKQSALLVVALRDIEGDLHQVNRLRAESGRDRWAQVDVFGLVRDMAAVRTTRLWSTLMPTSWPGGIRSEIQGSMAAGFSEVVLPAARDALLQKADSLLPRGEGGAAPTGYVGRATGTRDVYRYVADLRRLNDNVRRYNALAHRDSADVGKLGRLLEYAFGREVPDLSARHAHFYYRALRSASAPRITSEEGVRTRIAADLADTLVRRTYDDLGRRLDRLGEHSRALNGVRFASSTSLDRFRTLNQDINDVQGFFAESETFWLDAAAPLDPALAALLDSIGSTPLLDGPAFRDDFTRRFRNARLEKLRQMRAGVESYGGGAAGLYTGLGTGGGVPDDPRGDPRGALVLREALRELQKQSFSGAESAVSLRASPQPGMGVTWDPAYLDRALVFHADYERFLEGALRDLPVASQGFVRGLATVQLEAKMTRTIQQGVRHLPVGQTFGQRNA
ncbi:MAG TPA: type VI secretion system protein, partial [Longimicrobiaceae bacterium]|nr:type VI secretion system protein [Longimicrobiaceae bacterium]